MSKQSEQKRDEWINDADQRDYVNEKLNAFYSYVFPWGTENYASFDDFMTFLRQPLPICVRWSMGNERVYLSCENSMRSLADRMANYSKELDLTSSGPVEINSGTENISAHCVEWFQNSRFTSIINAWQVNASQRVLNLPEIKPRYKDIIDKINLGQMTRQEVVSMLPVLFLDIQSHHAILDLCAAPGSKTTQMLEILSQGATEQGSGYVVANDVNYKRLCVLIHQCSRSTQNAAHLVATKHCAMSFPSEATFDRVLCDVPCSGDGTLRKSPDLWVRWKASTAFHMHRQQVAILKKALSLLKPGGRIVYSTCSMNPIENEAVLFQCLTSAKQRFSLVDVTSAIPNLQCVPGVRRWKVMDDEGNWFDSYDEISPDTIARYHVTKSMFPPQEADDAINIHNAIRILPHFQNTGGFFIAVIERAEESEGATSFAGRAKVPRVRESKKPSLIQLTENNRRIIHSKTGLSDDFPWNTLIQRQEEGKRVNVYKVSEGAAALIAQNLSLNYQHVGMKAFEVHQDVNGTVLVQQEAVETMRPYVPHPRIIDMSSPDLVALLRTSASSSTIFPEVHAQVLEKIENSRDFFIASAQAADMVLDVGFCWNRFLQCWKARLNQAKESYYITLLEKGI